MFNFRIENALKQFINKFKNTTTMDFLLIGGIGTQEIILIVLVLLLLFGGKKLPELMRGAGRGIREFKDAVNTATKDDDTKPEVKSEKTEKTE